MSLTPLMPLACLTAISRTRTQTWMLRDSFNEVFPLHMREYAAKQFNDYYNHKMCTRPDDVPSYVKKHWPKDGVTSAHYDAYICVTAAMGIVTQHRHAASPPPALSPLHPLSLAPPPCSLFSSPPPKLSIPPP